MVNSPKKDPFMYQIIVFLWLCAILYFDPRILALVVGPENLLAKLTVIIFTLLLNLFWFYAFYHLVTIIFSYRRDKVNNPLKVKDSFPPNPSPSVALLYTTCNDFNENAALSCLGQDYGNFHTFILDDSDNGEYKGRIDYFASLHKNRATVIRRSGRKGYKAGNLNNGLAVMGNYEYFSVSDSDTILPHDYINKLLPYFGSPDVAFAQSRQEFNPGQKQAFARRLGYQIELHCDHYLRTKEKYGFVMFYGHGALMRTDILREIGGFPEVATEDLAYSMQVRQKGYRGVYAPDVTCLEEFPPTFQQYRRRNDKWIKGTAECLLKYYPPFLKSKNVSGTEKFDVFVSAVSLLLGLPFVALLLLVGIILPYFYYHFQFQGPMFKMPLSYNGTFLGALTGISSNLFWRWDFFLMLLVTLIAPVLPAIHKSISDPIKKANFIVMYTFIFYATQVSSACALVSYSWCRQAGFPVTGDVGDGRSSNKVIIVTEFIFMLLFLAVSLTSRNVWLLSFAAGTFAGLLILRHGFENRWARISVYFPILILAIVIIFIGKTLQ
jgi:cellulose synthase/poly-beta-1,6-N-acetylglucosamine synthase-like glycosyltransferase